MNNLHGAKYHFDCVSNTLYLSEAFYEKAGQYNSDEFNLLQLMRNDIPNLRIQVQARKKRKASTDAHLSMGTAGNYKFKVSQKWITDLTGMDESGYKRARKALAEMGWISHENNHIYVDFDKIWDDALANTMRGLAVTEDTNNAKMAQIKQGSNTALHDAAPRFVKNTPYASDSTKGSSNPSGGAMKNPIINNNKEEQIIHNKESFAEGVKGPRKIISHYRKPNERKVELLDINDYLEDP